MSGPKGSTSVQRQFDLVVFDIGGVLAQAGRTWAEDAAQAGFSFPQSWLDPFEARRRLLPRRGVGEIDSERFHLLLAEASDGVLSADDARRITNASFVAEYPGIDAVFDALEGAGMETAVLSNVNDAEWERLFPRAGVQPEFPTLARVRHRFASHLMRTEKPEPLAYREVERGTGTPGERIMFFDDRAENVESARRLGWTAELIDHTGDTAAQLLALLRRHGVIA